MVKANKPRSTLLAAWLAASSLLAPAILQAQALNPIWNGDWRLQQASIPQAAPPTLKTGGATRTQWTAGSKTCDMAYDGTVTQAALLTRLAGLQDWQLRPGNWPSGTDTSQLVGLRKEFDDAQKLLQSLPPDTYRRVRLAGPGCETQDDHFLLLNEGLRLFSIRFPANGLGADVALYQRIR